MSVRLCGHRSCQRLLLSRLTHQTPQVTSKGPSSRSTSLLSDRPVCENDNSIARIPHRNTHSSDMTIQIFVFLVTFDLDKRL